MKNDFICMKYNIKIELNIFKKDNFIYHHYLYCKSAYVHLAQMTLLPLTHYLK